MSINKVKCQARDRNNDHCRNGTINGTNFCGIHEYLCDYTDDMLANLSLCTGCNKMKYLVGKKTCDTCKNRSVINREKMKQEVILCKKDGCKFKKSNENEYCGKHQADYFKESTEKLNKKVCYNYIRGCREVLDLGYKFSKCQTCLE